jgi:hypothetical protein
VSVHEIRPAGEREAMVRRLEARLAELKAEHRRGEEFLAGLAEQERSARELLLRIEGAVQVLQEEIAHARAGASTEEDAPPSAASSV